MEKTDDIEVPNIYIKVNDGNIYYYMATNIVVKSKKRIKKR